MNKILIIVLIFFTTLSYGQRGNREKIKSLKVAFITDKLDLTSKEAQQFWPVYNKFEEKREVLRQMERKEIRTKIQDASELSEAEAVTLLEKYTRFKADAEKQDQTFLKEIQKVLSAKKTLILMRSEEEFKRQLIKQYRQNRGNRQ